MGRLEVVERVLQCQSCELAGVGSGPVPFSGPTPNVIAVLGEAPGRVEDERNQPFVGPAGELLRECLGDAQIPPGELTYLNTVSCFPGAGQNPTKAHIEACAGNREAQLAVTNPTWVLILGGIALSAYRPDLKIARARGHVLLHPKEHWRGFITFHPAYAIRNGKGEVYLRKDLETLSKMLAMARPGGWQELADDSCVACGAQIEELGEMSGEGLRVDNWNMPYCFACWATKAPQGREEANNLRALGRYQESHGTLFPS